MRRAYPAIRRARRELRSAVCAYCESPFTTRVAERRYCSLVCSNKARTLSPEAKQASAKAAHQRWRAKNPERVLFYREEKRLRSYGLTRDKYDALLARQDGLCPIGPHPFPPSDWKPCIDHDHDTGEVRGLLCRYHNTVLGQIETHAVAWRTYLGRETFR